ncbi:MAG TPA: bifunctional hydroxymethylpyrimidine kinase/phosphomethylpyrimidine kinase [Xanthobacteraceae bacterium]|jgi:hydroxymethylpyrimidine/phosphomethylpyrimidine kinase|nr:bifunctional hydroxymethylpyrimidine kinase/phosphomethylpyrimidine kinase [Xanthobacteraceae bacterium]
MTSGGSTPVAVTIAGSDSGGGAGLQGDLKTFAALGVFGASVVTALTAQNTVGVRAIHLVPADFITAQMDAVFSDLTVGAVKIGMLASAAAIEAVAGGLARWHQARVVLDPVMVASSGDRLLDPAAIDVLKRVLVPRVAVLTPNLPEAAALLGLPVAQTLEEMRAQAEALIGLGAPAVILKGGHASGDDSVDLLIAEGRIVALSLPRVNARNTHGTGCAFAAAVAAGFAKGEDLETAARAAKLYVHRAITAADSLAFGSGSGPIHHFHAVWPKA